MAWAGAWRWPLAGRQVSAAADAHAMHGPCLDAELGLIRLYLVKIVQTLTN
jgi:hypothetical protein